MSARPHCAARALLVLSLFILVSSFPALARAQTEGFVGRWETTFPGSTQDAVVDPSGNLDIIFRDKSNGVFLRQYDNNGTLTWTSSRFGDTDNVEAKGMACDAASNVYIVGTFTGVAVINGDTLISADSQPGDWRHDIFLTSYTSNGGHRFTRRWGAVGDDDARAIAVTSSGDIVIGANAAGAIDLGGGPLPPLSGVSLILARFDASLGHLWSKRYAPPAAWPQYFLVASIATDSAGDAYIGTNYGAGGCNDFGGCYDVKYGRLTKVDPLGNVNWNGVPFSVQIVDVVVDPTGNVDVLSNVLQADYDVLLPVGVLRQQYTPDGQQLWTNPGNPDVLRDHGQAYGMGVDAAGNILVARGRAAVPNPPPGFQFDAVDRFGNLYWSGDFVGTGYRNGVRCGVDAAGDLFLVGQFTGSITLNDEIYRSVAAQSNVFIIKGPPQVNYDIGAITDVPADEGGWVHVPFTRSNHDVAGVRNEVTEYQVLLEGGTTSVTWSVAGYTPATHADQYDVIALTTGDSTLTHGLYRSVYKIRAVSANPSVFFETATGEGYSTDNLVPVPPQLLGYSNGSIIWQPSPSPDIAYYSVFGSLLPNFDANAELIGHPTSSPFDVAPYGYYFISATDDAGLVSDVLSAPGVPDAVPPGAPLQLVYDHGALRWQPPADIDIRNYVVYGTMSETFSMQNQVSTPTTSPFDVTLEPYAYYFVTTVDLAGNEGPPSNVKDNVKPATPTGLDYDGSFVSWMASPDSGVDHYVVYGSPSTSFNRDAVRIMEITTTVADVSASPFKYYFVTVVDHAANESTPAFVVDQVPPSAPANLSVRSATLSWKPAEPTGIKEYAVYGSSDGALDDNDDYIGATTTTSLSIRDASYPFYVVTATDVAGNTSLPAVVKVDPKQAYPIALGAYPNPFNPETTIRCDVPSQGRLVVSLYNPRGELVKTLINEERAPGSYSVPWNGATADGGRASSGVYFVKLQHPAGTKTLKVILVR